MAFCAFDAAYKFEYAVAGDDSGESWNFCYNLHTSSEKPGFI